MASAEAVGSSCGEREGECDVREALTEGKREACEYAAR